jgi:predicted acylesterase/phospholipase RssA/CRP-like cAMP-binding protein
MTASAHRPLLPYLLAAEPFQHLEADTLQELETGLEWVSLAEGEALFRQGDPGDSLCVVVGGRLRISQQRPDGSSAVLDELGPGAMVGEIALLLGQTRSATGSAIEATTLVRLSRSGFDRLAETHPHATAELARAILPRLQRNELVEAIHRLFGDLGKDTLHALQEELVWHHYSNGEVVMRQGEPGDSLYLVVSGRLQVMVTNPDGGERLVGEVGRGESVGELALLTGEARAATVYAIRDTELVELSKESFERLVDAYPQVMLQITRLVVQRLQRTIRAAVASHTTATFAVIPLSPDAPCAAFARQLVQALQEFGPTLHLDPHGLDGAFGKPGAAQTPEDHPTNVTLGSWLDRQEIQYRYIVYEADTLGSAWTNRCLQQADRVLLVGDASGPLPGLPLPPNFQSLRVAERQELVLLHPPQADRPSGTQRWLSAYGARVHHHARLGREADFQRLARRLTGRAFGLVLGGGGARGFAHIGVIRALEEAGIPVDMVGGTSMGALIGAGYAMGRDHQAMVKLAQTFASSRQLLDYNPPLVSFLAGHKVSRVLKLVFGEAHIEDLWRPYFCISTNLTQARPVVHRQGPLWKYVRASSAAPGIFAPVLDQGDVLVDGMLVNNLPIDVMREQVGEGTVAAVNVSLERDLTTDYSFGDGVSAWEVLWSRINPLAPRVKAPTLFATLLRANEVNSVYLKRTQQRLADLYFRPPVERFAALNFSPYEQIIAIGYREAQQTLAAWQASGGVTRRR